MVHYPSNTLVDILIILAWIGAIGGAVSIAAYVVARIEGLAAKVRARKPHDSNVTWHGEV